MTDSPTAIVEGFVLEGIAVSIPTEADEWLQKFQIDEPEARCLTDEEQPLVSLKIIDRLRELALVAKTQGETGAKITLARDWEGIPFGIVEGMPNFDSLYFDERHGRVAHGGVNQPRFVDSVFDLVEYEDALAMVPAEGARVRLTKDVSRFPHFGVKAGATGTVAVAGSDSDHYAVQMDEPIKGGEEWGSSIIWQTSDGEWPHGEIELLPVDEDPKGAVPAFPAEADEDGDVVEPTQEQVEKVAAVVEAASNSVLSKAVSEIAGCSDWPGDVDPPTVFAYREATERVARQLLENALNHKAAS